MYTDGVVLQFRLVITYGINMDIKKWIQNLPIRSRLLYGYLSIFLLVMLTANSVLYLYIQSTINKNIASGLSNSTLSLQHMIEDISSSSIKNKLQTIAEKNLEVVIGIYQQDLKETIAKKRAATILSSQSIGKTGYIYAINSQGIVQAHTQKKLLNTDISDHEFVVQQIQRKYGYIEYDWSNPDESFSREKVLYMTYFGPWDWIISASAYKDEFSSMINADELRKAILAKQYGKTGYSFLMDSEGNLLVHPKLEGKNIYESEDSDGHKFIQEMCENKNGSIRYSWQNPGEPTARKKLVYYSYIPELDWIIASSGYPEEFHQPLKVLRIILLLSLVSLISLVVLLTWKISNSITKPIKYLTSGLQAVSNGDFSKRLSPKYSDELGKLENHFNTFITHLQESNTRLLTSEKGFRSIFENSVEGIFQFDMDGEILTVNPSFISMLGYKSGQALLDERINFHNDLIVKKELWNSLLELIIGEQAVKGFEVQIRKKSGSIFWCVLNARGVHDQETLEIVKIEGFLSDINDKKIAQESQEKILEDTEAIVNERTIELSNRIAELEHRNQLSRHMGEMGDMLQSCRSIDETFPVINQYLKVFFPGDNCTLYLHDSEKQLIDRVVPPVSQSDTFNSMTNESCWALRQGKSYLFQDMDQELSCDHVNIAPHGYLCIPLIAHGVTIGLFHIIFQDPKDAPEDEILMPMDRKMRLSSRLAEHLSLALANLTLQEELKIKSIQDSLTGLANRRHMEEIMQRQFHRLMRYNTPCSLLMLDVDHFKNFNDTYGHDLGDYVLQELGKYLIENTRGEDLACRFGGEEFIIIMVDTDTETAFKKAEKMCAEIAKDITIPYQSEKLHVTVSIGVATSPAHGRNTTELLKSADNALYQAKGNGRNRVEVAK